MEKYQVVKRLNVGTYGSAYLVTLKNSAQQYVLKKVKIEPGDEGVFNEVRLLRMLTFPLVLSYVDHFTYKGNLCIITEFCDGGDLYQLLRARKQPLPEPQLLDMFAQVVLAINHVHQKNILHRDLKTQNIFLTSSGSIRLGDFGVSRPLNGTLDLASTIIGTPYYMSPEVMSSMPYDFKSDMWSLGCVLYEMMSLKHAFDAADMSSLVMKILRGEHLPIPQGFSQELKDLVRQLLCKNPKLRPSAEQVLKMPFLKDHVSRARELVFQLEQRAARAGAAGGRRAEPSQAGVAASHRHSYSVGYGEGGGPPGGREGAGRDAGANLGGVSSDQLDRELEAAKERLRRIQLERELLAKQAQGGSAPGNHRYPSSGALPGGGGPPLAAQHSEPNLVGRSHQQQLSAASAQHAAAAGLKGKSWREKEEQVQRVQVRSQRELVQPGQYPHLAGDVGVALERHREQRQLRSSRPQSPEHGSPAGGGGAVLPSVGSGGSGGGAGGGGGGAVAGSPPSAAMMDPRARMKARKEEEARRREAELLNARKAYFEERKQAAARLQQLYTPSASNQTATNRRVTEGTARAYPAGGIGAGAGRNLGASGLDSSGDEMDDPASWVDGAAQEFEADAELAAAEAAAAAGAPNATLLQKAMDRGGVGDRVGALREVCSYNLGSALFELIYHYQRKRMAQGVHDDPAFRSELMQRLGPGRMQYVHLIDQLIYFEDMQAGGR